MHCSNVDRSIGELQEGDIVTYTVAETEKGLQAADVKVLSCYRAIKAMADDEKLKLPKKGFRNPYKMLASIIKKDTEQEEVEEDGYFQMTFVVEGDVIERILLYKKGDCRSYPKMTLQTIS